MTSFHNDKRLHPILSRAAKILVIFIAETREHTLKIHLLVFLLNAMHVLLVFFKDWVSCKNYEKKLRK